MLPPDSVSNIVQVLDADLHALPVWAVRALRLLLDERDALIHGAIGEPASGEIARTRQRLELAKQLLVEWDRQQDRYAHGHEGADYELGISRGMRACIDDLKTVLNGGL